MSKIPPKTPNIKSHKNPLYFQKPFKILNFLKIKKNFKNTEKIAISKTCKKYGNMKIYKP